MPINRPDYFQGPKIRLIGRFIEGGLPIIPTQVIMWCFPIYRFSSKAAKNGWRSLVVCFGSLLSLQTTSYGEASPAAGFKHCDNISSYVCISIPLTWKRAPTPHPSCAPVVPSRLCCMFVLCCRFFSIIIFWTANLRRADNNIAVFFVFIINNNNKDPRR